MSHKFPVKTWDGKIVRMTALELRDRIRVDSKRDYGWIASASDLVKVVGAKGFPEDFASEIKDLILNCFANLAVKKVYCESHQKKYDAEAVWRCYIDSKDAALKERFVKETIRAAILLEYGDDGLPFHSGPKHKEFEEKFMIEMADDLKRLELYANYELCLEIYLEWSKELQGKYHEEHEKAHKEGWFKDEFPFAASVLGAMKYFKLVNSQRDKPQ